MNWPAAATEPADLLVAAKQAFPSAGSDGTADVSGVISTPLGAASTAARFRQACRRLQVRQSMVG
jgi:hypothetical protein